MLSKTIFYLMENILHHVKDFFIFSSDIFQVTSLTKLVSKTNHILRIKSHANQHHFTDANEQKPRNNSKLEF